MATRAFLILCLLFFSTGCRPIMRAIFRSAARSAVRTAVAASSETDEEELTLEESMQQLAEAIEEAFVEPGEPMTFEQFASFNDNGQACVLFVKAPYSKVLQAYTNLAAIELESCELTNEYGVVDHAVVALNDCQWTMIFHSLGGSLWFDETAELAKRLKTRVFEFESDGVRSLYSVQPDGKKVRFMMEDDFDWAIEIAENDGQAPPKAKVIDNYSNMLSHYEILPPVFTYDEEGTLVLMPDEEDRIKRVMAMP